jgi:hypothetical protein
MFKIDKTTHLAILFTFALAFVVIYLYYTISDVRKVQLELKKVQDEVVGLQKLVTTLNTVKQECVVAPVAIPPQVQVDIKAIPEPEPVVIVEDDESVTSEEVHNILDATSDNDAEEDTPVPAPVPTAAPAQFVASTSVVEPIPIAADQSAGTIDFSSMKYDELRDLCKKHGLSTKGTREILLARVMESLSA